MLLLPILITLGFSFFFSGIEMAFLSANKLHIELQYKQGHWAGRLLGAFTRNPSQFLATVLMGNTLALVLYGYYMTTMLAPLLEQHLPLPMEHDIVLFIIQSFISTLIVLLIAEFTPKNIFMIKPNFFLSVLAIPIGAVYYLMYPFVYMVVNFSRFFTHKVLGLPYKDRKKVFELTDLSHYIKNLDISKDRAGGTTVDPRLFTNALDFKDVKIRDCMVPRTEIVAVNTEEGQEVLKRAFIKSGHSRVLLYKGSIDHVTGYCHSLELFKKGSAASFMPIPIAPEAMLASELLIQLLKEQKSIALVVDEYGGTAGIVTVEDIIEEIFGEIKDEHDDDEDLVEEEIGTDAYLFSARLEIDYLNEKYGFNLPTGDYDTLGGLILAVSESIPDVGVHVQVAPYDISITTKERNRIDKVKFVKLEQESHNKEK